MNNYKIGYVFNKLTNEYVGEETVYVEKRTGEYPHADNVTFIKPPTIGEHQKQVWNGKGWNIMPDYRGSIYYNEKGEPEGIIEDFGDLDGKIIVEPPRNLKNYEELRWNKLIWNWEIVLKEGYKIDEQGLVVLMTPVERIKAGLDELPENMKIVGDELWVKTIDDLFNEGKLTVEEYNKKIDEYRQSRFLMETDKMGLMYLRGECTLEEWKSAMDKIREELPKK